MKRLFTNRWALFVFWVIATSLFTWPAYIFTLRQIEVSAKDYLYEKGMDYTFSLQNKIHDKHVWLSSAANSLKFQPASVAQFLSKTIALNPEITQIQIQDKHGYVIGQIQQDSENQVAPKEITISSSPTLSLTRLRAIESFSTAFSQPYQLNQKLLVDMVLPTFTNGEVAFIYIFTIDTDFWVTQKSGIEMPKDIRANMVTTQGENDSASNNLIRAQTKTEFVSVIDSQEQHLQMRFAHNNPAFKTPYPILFLVFLGCGAMVGMLLISIHTTLLRRAAETALLTLTESLNAQSRIGLLGEVSLSIAHELNQPLTTIANYAAACEIKLKGMPDSSVELAKYLEQIREQTLRASEVVSSVRSFVQKKQNIASNINIGQVISKLEPILIMMSKDYKTSIEFKIQSDCRIHADPVLIEQVIINLAQNSLEAMDLFSENLRLISVEVSNEGVDHVSIQVIDNGSGIAPEILNKVLDPYFTTKPTGLGIGLSFSRSVVEKFGGRIKFSTNGSRGTKATLVFPRAKSP